MTENRNTATLIDRLSAPSPALIIGTVAWLVGTVVVLVSGDRWAGALPVCYAGIGVGLLGYGLFQIQRRAALRGSRGAQKGAGLID
ncbi:hypothetical protein ABH922_000539 [Rhodococcus sp. 27YEA15]|uniref:DUF2530 domain-containing protein n=1 Tax=Rhodococcus sp. 27YEA15 TaxID=3156259 RepID=UPI003C7AADEB